MLRSLNLKYSQQTPKALDFLSARAYSAGVGQLPYTKTVEVQKMLPMTAKQFERLTQNAVTRELVNCKTTKKRTVALYDEWYGGNQTPVLTQRLVIALKKLDAEMTDCRQEAVCAYHRDNDVEGN